jgi:hypothetical protein
MALSERRIHGFMEKLLQKLRNRFDSDLGIPCGRVTPFIGIVIVWFTPVSHIKHADIMTGDLNREV